MRVLLQHRESRDTKYATLCAMTPEHLSCARETWLEAFDQRIQAGHHNDDAILWERGFMSENLSATQGRPVGHVVLSSERIEGIVVTSPDSQPSQRDLGASLVYVRYLATAPWNRDGIIPEGGFLGIGRLLVARAVLDSVARGHDGRIGLHSFPAANPFYDALGFDSFGADPSHRGMTRYELRPQSAVTALAELGAHLVHNPDVF